MLRLDLDFPNESDSGKLERHVTRRGMRMDADGLAVFALQAVTGGQEWVCSFQSKADFRGIAGRSDLPYA